MKAERDPYKPGTFVETTGSPTLIYTLLRASGLDSDSITVELIDRSRIKGRVVGRERGVQRHMVARIEVKFEGEITELVYPYEIRPLSVVDILSELR